jgi:hypothetical protein
MAIEMARVFLFFFFRAREGRHAVAVIQKRRRRQQRRRTVTDQAGRSSRGVELSEHARHDGTGRQIFERRVPARHEDAVERRERPLVEGLERLHVACAQVGRDERARLRELRRVALEPTGLVAHGVHRRDDAARRREDEMDAGGFEPPRRLGDLGAEVARGMATTFRRGDEALGREDDEHGRGDRRHG